MIDIAAALIVAACATGIVLVALAAATHARRDPVPPVSRRAMRHYVERLPGEHDDLDGTQ